MILTDLSQLMLIIEACSKAAKTGNLCNTDYNCDAALKGLLEFKAQKHAVKKSASCICFDSRIPVHDIVGLSLLIYFEYIYLPGKTEQ